MENNIIDARLAQYGEWILKCLEGSIDYAAKFGIKLEWFETEEEIEGLYSKDIVDEKYVRAKLSLDALVGDISDDTIIASGELCSKIYSSACKMIVEQFPKCKKLNKMIRSEKEVKLCGDSFGELFTGISPDKSRLRTELDILNAVMILQETNPDKIAQC